jgi:hypothetical protein
MVLKRHLFFMIFSFWKIGWLVFPYKFNDDKDFTSKKVKNNNNNKNQNQRLSFFNLSFSTLCYCQTKYCKWIANLPYYVVKATEFFCLSFSTLCYCQTKYCKWIANLPYYVVNNCESDYYRIFFNRLFSGICLLLHRSFIFGRESV